MYADVTKMGICCFSFPTPPMHPPQPPHLQGHFQKLQIGLSGSTWSTAGWVKHTQGGALACALPADSPARTSSRQTWWTPSASAPPPGTAAPGTHAWLGPEDRNQLKVLWRLAIVTTTALRAKVSNWSMRVGASHTWDVLQSRSLILSLMSFIKDVML